jgi:hypothetical protein
MRSLRSSFSLLIFAFLAIAALMTQSPSYAAPRPTNTPSAPPPSCYKPQSVLTQISGYVEGSASTKGSTINGKEIVYNFATFQRQEFSLKSQMTTSGKVLGNYVGYVNEFIPNQNASNNYDTFSAQYAQQVLIDTLPADTPIWSGFTSLPGRKGTVHFTTALDVGSIPNPIEGYQSYLEIKNPPYSVGENGRSIYFAINGSPKSYIVNCLVNIVALTNDIESGNSNSFFSQLANSAAAPWRDAAVSAAQSAAEDYNSRVEAGAG